MSGAVIWFTGLPSAGKTTLARRVQSRLHERGVTACLLDSDEVRGLLAPLLGYSEQERDAFYAVLAGLAAELANQGLTVLVPATAHRLQYRARARELAPRFIEVWVTTPLDECRRRDSKGLYAAASSKAGTLPGVDVAYEPPGDAHVLAAGGKDEQAVERVLGLLDATPQG